MRIARVLVVTALGCSFHHGALPPPAALDDAGGDGAADARSTEDARDAVTYLDAAAVCGNGALEPGEECEPGMVVACATSCGDAGTQACNPDCTLSTCDVVFAPSTRWEVSTSGTTWTATSLPNVAWPCDNCTRFFRTTVCDQPTAVDFRWSSDNRARMTVNGTIAFNTYYLAGYCTDAPCCSKCCDTVANCQNRLSAAQTLDAAALGLFTAGPNILRWEVNEEVGGSGFYTVMTVRY